LTAEYAAIPNEMRSVAEFFGEQFLRDVDETSFFANLAEIRGSCGDRAVLRAIHFFGDNERVARQTAALERGDFTGFLDEIRKSGRSSALYLQNVFSGANPKEQGVSLALALSEKLLAAKGGAWRVHGGGFAGTIQAFVPSNMIDEYVTAMEAVFGAGACHLLSIRPVGGIEIT
jgi:galactokinase